MNNMVISTDSAMLGVSLSDSLIESPSVTTFLADEEASTCPLLPSTPSPPPMGFAHPLTPNAHNESNNLINCEDVKAETSSSGSSSGIVMDVADTATASLFNKHAYHHLGKNQENILQENGIKQNSLLDIPITKDTPSFVSWNWPLIRKCTFFVFMSSLLAMCAIVIAMIVTLPRTCNPKTAWFRGGVFYEIFPASFQDSNNDGLGDLRGITSRLDYLENMGITAIRLNSIFPSNNYPDNYENISSLADVDGVLGSVNDVRQLAMALHARNISLVLDLPIYPHIQHLQIATTFNKTNNENITEKNERNLPHKNYNIITEAIQMWLSEGVDGFYIKGLQFLHNDSFLLENIAEWKFALGKDRVLIVNEIIFENLNRELSKQILQHVDLVEVHLDVSNGTKMMNQRISSVMSGLFAPHEYGPWIQWALGGVSKQRISKELNSNVTMAATIMQLMLPGTPNIFYGDEISLEGSHDPYSEHEETKHLHHLSAMAWSGGVQFTNRDQLPWLPHGASAAFDNYNKIAQMIRIRDHSPSIYKNAIIKENQTLQNANIRNSNDDILIIERTYPRRNTFISISNFGSKLVAMDLSSLFYSGHVVLGPSQGEKIYFGEFQIGPLQTVIIKLDK